MSVVIQVDKLSKQYRLGTIGGKRLVDDVNRWWAKLRGHEDPLSKVSGQSSVVSSPQSVVRGQLSRGQLSVVSGPSPVVSSPSDTIYALRDVSFEVKQGEVLGIIGRNGAGKSTLLKILSRVTAPTSGEVRVKGRIASLLEVGTGFHPELTGRENIFLNGAILGMTKAEIRSKFDEIVAFSEVEQFIDTPVKRYSSGMTVRLAFAVAAHLEPEILIVDEVLAVGDAAFQKRCLGKMQDVAKEGRTILFVSHNMPAVKSLCTRAVLLANGSLEAQGEVAATLAEYLGDADGCSVQRKAKLPVTSEENGVRLNDCRVFLEENASEGLSLRIEAEWQALRALGSVGFGMTLSTLDGTKVSMVDPYVTEHVLSLKQGSHTFIFACDAIEKYLAGGEYILELWIEKPRVAYLLRVPEVAQFTVPTRSLFPEGKPFTLQRNGVVPLPMRLTVAETANH